MSAVASRSCPTRRMPRILRVGRSRRSDRVGRLGWSRRDAGFVTVWTVALAFACVSLVGLVHDAGRALRAKSDAFGTAAAAARAGAQEIDRAAAVTGTTRLDEDNARSAAAAYLANRGIDGSVTVADMDVTVTVIDPVGFQILPGSITVDATATAHAAQGPTPP